MDGCQVPEHKLGLVAGVRRDGDSLRCLTNELLELLRHGDDVGAERSSVDEKLPPPPPAPAMATDISSSNQLKLSAAREAEMASWVRQVFEQDASDHEPPRPATTEPGGGRSAAATGTSSAAANKAECCRGRRHGRPRSHAERAAEQRRRDKIHENMRTLQQLVPWCKKTDKASTLEEVVNYVKFLQHQLQVLSNGFAMQTAILPPDVVPPPCMQPAGDVFGVQPVIVLPQYTFVPAMFACPHHGNDCAPLPAPAPLPLYHHQPVGISATQQRLNHHRVPDLSMPSHRKADPRTTKMKREKAERSARPKLNRFSDVI